VELTVNLMGGRDSRGEVYWRVPKAPKYKCEWLKVKKMEVEDTNVASVLFVPLANLKR
jgi:hypothetical protein